MFSDNHLAAEEAQLGFAYLWTGKWDLGYWDWE
jgi:hypothetical protein